MAGVAGLTDAERILVDGRNLHIAEDLFDSNIVKVAEGRSTGVAVLTSSEVLVSMETSEPMSSGEAIRLQRAKWLRCSVMDKPMSPTCNMSACARKRQRVFTPDVHGREGIPAHIVPVAAI